MLLGAGPWQGWSKENWPGWSRERWPGWSSSGGASGTEQGTAAASSAPQTRRPSRPSTKGSRDGFLAASGLAVGAKAYGTLEKMCNPSCTPMEVCKEVTELAHMGNMGSPILIDANGNGRPDVATTLLADGRFDGDASVRFDLDGGGLTEAGELQPLAEGGIIAVGCHPRGNSAPVRYRNGTEGRCWDWWPDLRF